MKKDSQAKFQNLNMIKEVKDIQLQASEGRKRKTKSEVVTSDYWNAEKKAKRDEKRGTAWIIKEEEEQRQNMTKPCELIKNVLKQRATNEETKIDE
jgi:hypothetical protein